MVNSKDIKLQFCRDSTHSVIRFLKHFERLGDRVQMRRQTESQTDATLRIIFITHNDASIKTIGL